jgi:hypothetical protein
MNRKLTTGKYETTDFFARITSHVAVCFDDDGGLVAVTGPTGGDPENEAYARLFAAAPDLLEALEAIEQNGGTTWDYATIGNVARAALQKARGEDAIFTACEAIHKSGGL